jgi:hypothetical protein
MLTTCQKQVSTTNSCGKFQFCTHFIQKGAFRRIGNRVANEKLLALAGKYNATAEEMAAILEQIPQEG